MNTEDGRKGRLPNLFFTKSVLWMLGVVGGFAGRCFKNQLKLIFDKTVLEFSCFSQPSKTQMACKQAESNMYTYNM